MTTKTKTTTKSKIKDSLKNVFINELKDKKETERLEKVKLNSKLSISIIYTNKTPYCDVIKKHLDSEGIKYIEKTQEKYPELVTQAMSITNINNFPIILINENYLVPGRDFQQPSQLSMAIQHLGNPKFKNPSFEDKMLEHSKTNNYNIWTKLNNLEQQLSPVIKFITNLQKELELEEKGE